MRFLLLTIMIVVITGCGTGNVREAFDQNLKTYNDLLSAHDMDKVEFFAAKSIKDEFRARAASAHDVMVFDYQITSVNYDEATHKATAEVEISYYLKSSPRVRTLHDVQEWAYVAVNGRKEWRLLSLLPEFK